MWVAAALIIILALLAGLCCNVVPELRRWREQSMRPTGKGEEGYFITAPRTDDSYGFFRTGYELFLEWARNPQSPLLFLTGSSGSGKSSLLDAYMRPKLAEPSSDSCTQLLIIRSYHDPLAELKREMLRFWAQKPPDYDTLTPLEAIRRAARQLKPDRLLIAFDQFEEFFILRIARTRTKRSPFRSCREPNWRHYEKFFRGFCADPPKGIAVLLSYRDDYHRFLAPLNLPAREDRKNWMTVDSLDFAAAARFLSSCPGLQVPKTRMDRVLREAARQEGTRVLMRPIVANLLGLILSRMSGHPTLWRRSDDLLRGYIREELGQESREERASILKSLLTDFHTARPRPAAEIAREVRLDLAIVNGHLERFGHAGLLRSVSHDEPNPGQRIWQVAHDFLATLIERVLDGVHRTLWRRVRHWVFPATLLLAATFSVFAWQDSDRRARERDSETARDILAKVGNQPGYGQDANEDAAFWDLAEAADNVKLCFLQQVLSTGGAVRFNRRAEWIVQSAVGMNPDLRRKVLDRIWLPSAKDEPDDPKVAIARGLLGKQIGVCEFLPDHSVAPLIGSLEGVTDPKIRRSLAAAMTAFAHRREPVQVEAAFDQFFEVALASNEPSAQRLSGEVIETGSGRLRPERVEGAFDPLLEAMQKSKDRFTLFAAARLLVALAKQLPADHAQAVFDRLLDTMLKTKDQDMLRTIVIVVTPLAGRLRSNRAGTAIERLLDITQKVPDPDVFANVQRGHHYLLGAINAAAGKLESGQLKTVLDRLIGELQKDPNREMSFSLVVALRDLVGYLGPENAQATFDRLLSVRWRGGNAYGQVALGAAIRNVAAKLPREQAIATFDKVIDEMKKPTSDLYLFAQALKGLPGRLRPDQGQAAFDRILDANRDAAGAWGLWSLAETLGAVPGEMKPEQSEAIFKRLLETLPGSITWYSVEPQLLAEALEAVPGPATLDQAATAFDWLLRTIQKSPPPDPLRALTGAMIALANRMTSEQACLEFDRLLEAVQRSGDPAVFNSLSEVLAVVVTRLRPELAPKALTCLIEVTQRTTHPDALLALVNVLRAVPGNIEPGVVIEILKRPSCCGEARRILLDILERSEGAIKFDGDLWKAVQWADSQRDADGKPRFDLRQAPKRSILSTESSGN